MTRRLAGDEIARTAMEQGFRVKRTRSGWWVYGKDGVSTMGFHRNPRPGNRAYQNLVADLRRMGVDL